MLSDSQRAFGAEITRELERGQLIEVGLTGGDRGRWFTSRLVDHDDEGEVITIVWPEDDGLQPLPLRSGQTLVVEASWPDDALYAVDTEVLRLERGASSQVVVRAVSGWRRLQRRLAVRLPVVIRPTLSERLTDNGWWPIRSVITDLSAGGLRVRSQDQLSVGDRLDFSFELPDQVNMDVRVRVNVRRVDVRRHESLQVWEAGCQFHEPRAKNCERIVRYIFAQQRVAARRRQDA